MVWNRHTTAGGAFSHGVCWGGTRRAFAKFEFYARVGGGVKFAAHA
jgi:hypothetical protein